MIKDTMLADAGQQYAAAYDAHYKTKNMYEAFKLYERIIASHPDTREAGGVQKLALRYQSPACHN